MKDRFAATFLTATAALMLAGCAEISTTKASNTNLTPRTIPADAGSNYLFETTFDSIRRNVDPASVKAWVMIEAQLYPMSRVPNTLNRFEALVPLPPGKSYLVYRYKFEFGYPGLGTKEVNSDWSPEYRMVVPQH